MAGQRPALLTSEKAPVVVTVQSVIVYRGPGSWKRDAYWDEYIVALANPGEATATLESVTLTDFTGTASPPSDNPWALEKQSRDREAELRAIVKDVLIQIGGGYVIMSAAVTGGLAVAGFTGGLLAMLQAQGPTGCTGQELSCRAGFPPSPGLRRTGPNPACHCRSSRQRACSRMNCVRPPNERPPAGCLRRRGSETPPCNFTPPALAVSSPAAPAFSATGRTVAGAGCHQAHRNAGAP